MSTNAIQDTSSSFDFLKNLIKETSTKLHIKTGSAVDFNKVKDKENTESKNTVQEIKEEFDIDNIKPLNPRELGYQDFEEDVEKEKVGVNSLINASKKLLAINQGLTEPDERDSLVNVRVLNIDDLIDERVRLDAGKLRNALLFKLSKARSLKNLMSGFFDSYATGHIVGNPLSAPSEEINPLMISEQATRITKFGPGGIGSLDALTAESQNVHPSQFGFIDIISTPESARAGADVRMTQNARLGKKDGKLYTRVRERKTGKLVWMTPEEMGQHVIGIPK